MAPSPAGQVSSANQEYQNILSQIGNIGSTTNFNSGNVFSSSATNIVVTDGTSSGLNTYADTVGSLTTASVGTSAGTAVAASAGSAASSAATTAATTVASTAAVVATNTFTLAAATDELSGTFSYKIGSGSAATVALGSTPLSLANTVLALNGDSGFSGAGLVANKSGANLVITGTTGASGAADIDTTGSTLTTTTPAVAAVTAHTAPGAGSDFTAVGVSTLTAATAATVLTTVTSAIANVAYQRGTIGADINELTSASNVASSEERQPHFRGRICPRNRLRLGGFESFQVSDPLPDRHQRSGSGQQRAAGSAQAPPVSRRRCLETRAVPQRGRPAF